MEVKNTRYRERARTRVRARESVRSYETHFITVLRKSPCENKSGKEKYLPASQDFLRGKKIIVGGKQTEDQDKNLILKHPNLSLTKEYPNFAFAG